MKIMFVFLQLKFTFTLCSNTTEGWDIFVNKVVTYASLSYDPYSPASAFFKKLLTKVLYEG